MTYHLYDIHKAYDEFVARFGIEPNGILMNEGTLITLKEEINRILANPINSDIKEFMGKPIFRSNDMEMGKLRFVI